MKYNLSKEEISMAIIHYLSKYTDIQNMESYNIKFIVEDVYQKDSLTGYYRPEFKGVEVSINQ